MEKVVSPGRIDAGKAITEQAVLSKTELKQPEAAKVAELAKDISKSPFGQIAQGLPGVKKGSKGFIALGNAMRNLPEAEQEKMLGLLNTSQVDVDAGARNGLARAKAHGLSIDMSKLGEHFNRLGAGKAAKFIEKCLSDTSAGADPTKTLFRMLAARDKQK